MMTEDEETAIKHGVALIMNIAIDAGEFCQTVENDPLQRYWFKARQQAYLSTMRTRREHAQKSLANCSAALEWLLSSSKPTAQ